MALSLRFRTARKPGIQLSSGEMGGWTRIWIELIREDKVLAHIPLGNTVIDTLLIVLFFFVVLPLDFMFNDVRLGVWLSHRTTESITPGSTDQRQPALSKGKRGSAYVIHLPTPIEMRKDDLLDIEFDGTYGPQSIDFYTTGDDCLQTQVCDSHDKIGYKWPQYDPHNPYGVPNIPDNGKLRLLALINVKTNVLVVEMDEVRTDIKVKRISVLRRYW